jgi:hypothetical protein
VLPDYGIVFTARFADRRAGCDTINGFHAKLRHLLLPGTPDVGSALGTARRAGWHPSLGYVERITSEQRRTFG